MTLQRDVDTLRNIPLFSKIDPSKLKLLAFTSERLEFQPGDQVCAQGERGDAAFIVLEGKADVFVDTEEGPVRVAQLGKNDIIGEIAILCDVPRTATVVASAPLVTLRISKDAFFNLVTQFPEVAIGVMHELASRLHQTTQRLIEASARLRKYEGDAA
ncbi:MAG TPA: cyclic nucleotide-binding domain-containing protein [Rhodospirillales bacterium]|nr:cyclic nucleotide-binding domain-containing protein [Rhodospirillales bacterium]